MGLFALKYLAGIENVSHYTGSMLAWEADPRELMKWDYENPAALRDNFYLSEVGGQGRKLLGFHGINFIDLREASEYATGHPEYSLNIPYSLFRQHWGKWNEFAALIGPAGVEPSYEAVLWGLGLSKEAALAYFMLEYMGQSKSGIGYNSVAAWPETGKRLITKNTVVQKQTVPWDMAIAPAQYIFNEQPSMVAHLDQEPVYPRIFVDSGESPSKNIQVQGDVRHVPFVQAAQGDRGMLDWVTLYWHFKKDNNLPKLAEIVCFADDPADAAFNWFALKQAGYPKVTVLIP